MRIIARGFVLSRSRLVLLLAFLIFQASFLSTAGIHAAIGIAIARARENLAFRCCCTTSVTNARASFVLIFYLTEENISSHSQFVRVNQLAKNEPFNISPFFLLELSARCVRACVRASTLACDPFAWSVAVH